MRCSSSAGTVNGKASDDGIGPVAFGKSSARTFGLRPLNSGPSAPSTTSNVFALILRAEVKPARLLRSKLTASALPIRSYVIRKPPRTTLLPLRPKILPKVLSPKSGDHANATDGAQLFQSCL